MKNMFILMIFSVAITGCASPNMLPKGSTDVDYSAIGMVKGSGWNDGAVYEATEDEIIVAIREALTVNGLKIQEFSKENRKFVAEMPMNLYRWASHVGVYYRPKSEKKFEVHVVALSVKDVNLLAGDSEAPMPPKILASIQSSLSKR